MLVYAVNMYVSFACIICMVGTGSGESELGTSEDIVLWHEQEVFG